MLQLVRHWTYNPTHQEPMQENYEKAVVDYSDLASGRVFYSSPGFPAFPVRLASEIFQRFLANRTEIYKDAAPCTLYDPCCGAAYHLSVIGYLHGKHIRQIIGSDVDEKAIALARRNLSLLSVAGLDQRIAEITKMLEQYHKDSHKDALTSAHLFRNKIAAFAHAQPLTTKVFQPNATDRRTILDNLKAKSVDIVFTDVPYGLHSQWKSPEAEELLNPLGSMLNALGSILSSS